MRLFWSARSLVHRAGTAVIPSIQVTSRRVWMCWLTTLRTERRSLGMTCDMYLERSCMVGTSLTIGIETCARRISATLSALMCWKVLTCAWVFLPPLHCHTRSISSTLRSQPHRRHPSCMACTPTQRSISVQSKAKPCSAPSMSLPVPVVLGVAQVPQRRFARSWMRLGQCCLSHTTWGKLLNVWRTTGHQHSMCSTRSVSG
mmetsp:Transcript_57054/g.101901  ORF Transcript_57054/g.101901 Transcript_57054/m.101901 type:complete len:202 (-) Transcript_57054:1933-2538(-)